MRLAGAILSLRWGNAPFTITGQPLLHLDGVYVGTTVVPRITNVPTYNHFKLRRALAANFCFNLWLELPVTNRKGQGEKQEIQIANCWWRRGCFFVVLSPQQLESVQSEEAAW